MSTSPQPASTPAPAAGAPRIDPESLLRRLEWTVLRRLDGLLQGDYRTLFRGFGLDLADLREYQPRDDVRYIDWNVTARTQVPYVREFLEEREVSAWFLLDLSGSIDFGSGTVAKRSLAIDLVTVLGRLLTRYGNRVGAVLYSNGVDAIIPARGGRRHLLHLIDSMLRPGNPAAGKVTDLGQLFATARRVIPRRSVVLAVSDWLSTPGWDAGLALLARRHEVIAIRLYDPLEMELPDLGMIVVQDAETGEQMFVDTHDRVFRRRFAEAAARRETAILEAFASAGVDCLELATDDDLAESILRFTGLRKRRSQLATGGVPAPLARG